MRSFLGLVGYYRRFVKGLSVIASTLTKLLRNGVKFELTDKCQASFNQLKRMLVQASVLTQPTPSKEYTMYNDASRNGLGCVLMQDGKAVTPEIITITKYYFFENKTIDPGLILEPRVNW